MALTGVSVNVFALLIVIGDAIGLLVTLLVDQVIVNHLDLRETVDSSVWCSLIKAGCTVGVFHHLSLGAAHLILIQAEFFSARRVITLFDIVQLICNCFRVGVEVHVGGVLFEWGLLELMRFDVDGVIFVGFLARVFFFVGGRACQLDILGSNKSVDVRRLLTLDDVEIDLFASCLFGRIYVSHAQSLIHIFDIYIRLQSRFSFLQLLLNVRIIRQ